MGEYLGSASAPETRLKESFVPHNSKHLTIQFATSVDDNQQTDYSSGRHKK
jgi:hypothetical protein